MVAALADQVTARRVMMSAILAGLVLASCGETQRPPAPRAPTALADLSQFLAAPLNHYVHDRNKLLARLRTEPGARQALSRLPPGSRRALARALVAMLPPDGRSDIEAAQASFVRWLSSRRMLWTPRLPKFWFDYVPYERRRLLGPLPADLSIPALLELATKSPASLADSDLFREGFGVGRDDRRLALWIQLEAVLALAELGDRDGPAILEDLLDSELVADFPDASSVMVLCVDATKSVELVDRLIAAIGPCYGGHHHAAAALERLVERHPARVRRYLDDAENGNWLFRRHANNTLEDR